MGIKFKDNSLTTLASSIAIGATTLAVPAGKGDNFPAITGAGTPGSATDYSIITMENAAGQRELIKVEHRAAGSDTLGSGGYPLIRGYGGSTARAWTAGDSVDLRLPATVLEAELNSVNRSGDTMTGALGMTGAAINEAHGADIASAATVNLDTATGNTVDVTGTTGITAITLSDGWQRTVRFTGSLLLTHGASLVLPGASNIQTAAGDFAVFKGYAAGVVRCTSYSRLNQHGADVASSGTIDLNAATGDLVDVTGTTAITTITLADGRVCTVRFTGSLLLTHGASLVLPGAASIQTAAGDFAVFRGYAAGVVRCVGFFRTTDPAIVPTGAMFDWPGTVVPSGYLERNGANVSRATYAALFAVLVRSAVVTFDNTTDKVAWAAHALSDGDVFKFSTTGGAPTGLTAGTTYFVRDSAANDFKLAATEGGAAINFTTDGTGVHTGIHAPFGDGDGATTFTVPDSRRRVAVGRGGSATATLGARLAATGGAETHTLSTAEMPSHTHDAGIETASNVAGGNGFMGATGAPDANIPNQATGGGGVHNNMQPSIVVTKIIKT